MPSIEDIEQSRFHFTNSILPLNGDADLELENKIVRFYEELSGIEQYSKRDKATFIHDEPYV